MDASLIKLIRLSFHNHLGSYRLPHLSFPDWFCCFNSVYFQELIEKVSKGELPKNEYHCMNDSTDPLSNGSQRINGGAPVPSIRAGQSTMPHSMRSRRTATWARSHFSDDGSSK